jgi:CRP-like cAMP-binding protein
LHPVEPDGGRLARPFGGVREETTVVLREDADLAEPLDHVRGRRAEAASVAAVVRIGAGRWDARADSGRARGGFGLLMLDGALVRRVGFESRYGAELLAAGDILQPWQHDGEDAVMPFETTWHVLSPTRFAVLDRAWAARLAPYPEVGGELVGRALLRSRRLAVMIAIAQHPRLEERLWLLFWELADRLGTVRRDGVLVRVDLTQELLGHLVAARRPSVSAALGRLAREERIQRVPEGWLLHGDAPCGSPSEPDG